MQYRITPEESKEACEFSDLAPGDLFLVDGYYFLADGCYYHANPRLYMKMGKGNGDYPDYRNVAVDLSDGDLTVVQDNVPVMRYVDVECVFSRDKPDKDALYRIE